jgi:CRP/FNR family transcriptional regulator, dissimilatory nitrate respiration regulator
VRRPIRTEQLLARLPLFAGLGAAELARLAAATSRRDLKRGEFLFRKGEAPTGFYLVVHGRIELRARSPHGRERVTDIVGAGRSFGEAIMFLDKPYIVSAKALGDVLVLHVAKDTVFAELERNPAFGRRLIATLSAKLHAAARELDTYALGSGEQRFAAWLLRAAAPAERGAVTVTLPAAKRAIASRLNLSAEHLSRILRHLSAEGLIEVRGRSLDIPDVARLRAWSKS